MRGDGWIVGRTIDLRMRDQGETPWWMTTYLKGNLRSARDEGRLDGVIHAGDITTALVLTISWGGGFCFNSIL